MRGRLESGMPFEEDFAKTLLLAEKDSESKGLPIVGAGCLQAVQEYCKLAKEKTAKRYWPS